MNDRLKQPWLHSAGVDSLFILSPPFLCLLAIVLFPGFFQHHVHNLPVPAWVVLILLIDVGHVYSTLFRTYLEKETWQQKRQLLVWVPFGAWAGGIMLYSLAGTLFWSILAYLAVYHFVRQQYGFMRLYSRHEQRPKWEHRVDTFCVYAATLLPLLYWHLEGNRNFNWFIEHDFLNFRYPAVASLVAWVNGAVFLVYLTKELWVVRQTRYLNFPRTLVVAGTFLAWHLGIITYNGDLVFTAFNVVSHGIPYLALVWIYREKQGANSTSQHRKTEGQRVAWSVVGIGSFVGLVVALAYLEEGLWDSLVWREHTQVFSFFQGLPQVRDPALLSILVPLLALPQMTHYILDGFIWKMAKKPKP